MGMSTSGLSIPTGPTPTFILPPTATQHSATKATKLLNLSDIMGGFSEECFGNDSGIVSE